MSARRFTNIAFLTKGDSRQSMDLILATVLKWRHSSIPPNLEGAKIQISTLDTARSSFTTLLLQPPRMTTHQHHPACDRIVTYLGCSKQADQLILLAWQLKAKYNKMWILKGIQQHLNCGKHYRNKSASCDIKKNVISINCCWRVCGDILGISWGYIRDMLEIYWGYLGPLVHWSIGPLVQWSIGPLVNWSIVPLVYGPLVLWSVGPLDYWFIGSLVECQMLNAKKVNLLSERTSGVPPVIFRSNSIEVLNVYSQIYAWNLGSSVLQWW